jgi:hypothetical protein
MAHLHFGGNSVRSEWFVQGSYHRWEVALCGYEMRGAGSYGDQG